MTGDPDREWALLAKYLVNELTEEEKLEVEALLKGDDGLRKDFQKLTTTYYYSHETKPVDTTEFFKKLTARIKKTDL